MKVVIARPPMYDEIAAAFQIAGRHGVIFAWGDTIYNPAAVKIPPELMAHERVHAMRQGTDVEGWWRKYIADPKFRLAEEVPAHIAEYHHLLSTYGSNRQNRRKFAAHCGKRLSSSLYGSMISFATAKQQLMGTVEC